MTQELIAAIQVALSKQFEAGKAVGVLENLMLPLMPKPTGEASEEKPEMTKPSAP